MRLLLNLLDYFCTLYVTDAMDRAKLLIIKYSLNGFIIYSQQSLKDTINSLHFIIR